MATVKTPRLNLAKQASGDNPGTWEVDLNTGFDDADARFFRSGATDPVTGAETADYIGQRYFDTVSLLWWAATAAGAPGTWVKDFDTIDPLVTHPADPVIPLPIFTKIGIQLTRVSATEIGFGLGEVRGGTAANRNLTNGRSIIANFSKTFVTGGWVAGDGNSGVAAATPLAAAIDTWHLFQLIGTDESVDFGLDTSITAANLVADAAVQAALTATVHYKRVGSLVCTIAPDFADFINMGNRIQLAVPVHDVDIINPGTAQVLHTLPSVPDGIRVLVQVAISGDRDATWYLLAGGGDAALPVPSDTNHHFAGIASQQGRRPGIGLELITNTVQQIATRQSTSDASFLLDINVLGWADFLQD